MPLQAARLRSFRRGEPLAPDHSDRSGRSRSPRRGCSNVFHPRQPVGCVQASRRAVLLHPIADDVAHVQRRGPAAARAQSLDVGLDDDAAGVVRRPDHGEPCARCPAPRAASDVATRCCEDCVAERRAPGACARTAPSAFRRGRVAARRGTAQSRHRLRGVRPSLSSGRRVTIGAGRHAAQVWWAAARVTRPVAPISNTSTESRPFWLRRWMARLRTPGKTPSFSKRRSGESPRTFSQ